MKQINMRYLDQMWIEIDKHLLDNEYVTTAVWWISTGLIDRIDGKVGIKNPLIRCLNIEQEE